jgi:aromatic ring-opening dioxygenase catalytic subunit (LigB family)
MGQIVVAAAMSHAPGIVAFKDQADPDQARHFYEAVEHIAGEVRAAEPDVIVLVTNEHYVNFYLNNVPALCVGTASTYRGPAEPFMGEEREIPGDRKLGLALLGGLLDREFDPSFSEDLVFDHGTIVPLNHLNAGDALPVVPIFVNNLFDPMPAPRRLYQLGQTLADIIVGLPRDRRVALLGTGGLSHWVGTPEAGEIDADWDRRFLESVNRGEGSKLADLTSDELGRIGNGTHEVRNWLTVMGAIGDIPADFTVYEPVAGWATGCAAAVWKPA